ncbi:SDR family oxidoreductase [bacterium]|nr:MAG: SDR family oxidoreductase [bacterium]
MKPTLEPLPDSARKDTSQRPGIFSISEQRVCPVSLPASFKMGSMQVKEWALVTGAASGIGAELCRLFAKDGAGIVLVDRNKSGLDSISEELTTQYGIETVSLVFDLSKPEAPSQIFEALKRQNIEVDILVNNAGFGTYGNFWETDLGRDQALIDVNIMAPVLLSKLFLPSMVQRRRGRVMNMGSISGFSASPYASTYYASKSFLQSFSQGVGASLKGTGVTMTVVCPGPTYTAFDWQKTADGGPPPERKKFQMDAAEVAAQGYRGMRRGQAVVIPGLSNKALAVLAKLLPRKFALWLTTAGQKKAN